MQSIIFQMIFFAQTCSQSYKTILIFKKSKLVLNNVMACYTIKGHVSNLTSIEVTHPQQI